MVVKKMLNAQVEADQTDVSSGWRHRNERCSMSASLLGLVVRTNMDKQTATQHSPFTVAGSGSSWGSDSPPAGSEGTCMVGDKEAKLYLGGWWLMTEHGWMHGTKNSASLTFDSNCLVSFSTSSELSFVGSRESSESLEYSEPVTVSLCNPWVWVLIWSLDISECRMDIQQDCTLVYATVQLHLMQQHIAHSLTCVVTGNGTYSCSKVWPDQESFCQQFVVW